MPKYRERPKKVKFRQRTVNRRRKKVAYPPFDTDAQASIFLTSMFKKLIPFWPAEYIDGDLLLLPPVDVLWEASQPDEVDNDIPSTFEFYLQNFYGYEPEDPKLAELAKAVQTGHKMSAEELHYVAGYFLGEHSLGG